MYQSVSPNVNFVEQEKKIEAFWEEEHIFEKSIDSRKKGTPYVFYDGPPTANGKPHIGHVLTRVIKDMIPRYRTMKGYMGCFYSLFMLKALFFCNVISVHQERSISP